MKDLEEYFKDLNNVDKEEPVIVNMCGFDGTRWCSYFGLEEGSRTEVKVRMKKAKEW